MAMTAPAGLQEAVPAAARVCRAAPHGPLRRM